jgi:hypothetical protein
MCKALISSLSAVYAKQASGDGRSKFGKLDYGLTLLCFSLPALF